MSLIDEMRVPRDWKGNEIKEGHEIAVVSTKPLFGTMRFGFMTPDGFVQQGEAYEPPKHKWDVSEFVKIWMDESGRLRYTCDSPNGHKYTLEISTLVFFKQDSDIIVIKGISDNEQEYYTEYFK